MPFEWIREDAPPRWDESKQSIIGSAPKETFDASGLSSGDIIAGDWWRVEEDGRCLGYGWMDVVWGDAQILLAVAPDQRKRGIGAFILGNLEGEARKQGLNYLFNTVPAEHPDAEAVSAWLTKQGFKPSEEDRLSRRVVSKAE